MPDMPFALNYWANTLDLLAGHSDEPLASQFRTEAMAKRAQAQVLYSFWQAKNAALSGKHDEAILSLRNAMQSGYRITSSELYAEASFDTVRGQFDFQKFIASLPES